MNIHICKKEIIPISKHLLCVPKVWLKQQPRLIWVHTYFFHTASKKEMEEIKRTYLQIPLKHLLQQFLLNLDLIPHLHLFTPICLIIDLIPLLPTNYISHQKADYKKGHRQNTKNFLNMNW